MLSASKSGALSPMSGSRAGSAPGVAAEVTAEVMVASFPRHAARSGPARECRRVAALASSSNASSIGPVPAMAGGDHDRFAPIR
ncbi:hypothetical protein Msi02_37660 [Microbispora siamensis]|uniref:Uncharacterized protein n=1 Tax=Microbispora siamensis TaxID=564413 RepID=A0ABQ4GNE1_9ACTN|nr:hypothetical protein Msi02_37660 [Microbispora siamensis]